jgi:hypothetical protein
MNMENLKDSLKALRDELESTSDMDPETKDLLRGLDRDIHQLLEKEGKDADESAGLVGRAQAISARLAVRHPHFEPALREVADTLARMGI